MKVLLKGHATGKNIIWATGNCGELGRKYSFHEQISVEHITSKNGEVIRPRIEKLKMSRSYVHNKKAEVFTPLWVRKEQNNLIDEAWFGSKRQVRKFDVNGKTKNGESWQEYVKLVWLEITCGEAPYICSCYDTTTGKKRPLKQRVGFLDRKLQAVDKFVDSESDWLKWTKIAYKACLGYVNGRVIMSCWLEKTCL
jgi:hypothetical protein